MTNYITFFAALTLSGILYAIYYSNFIFVPRMKKLKLVQEFRYAANLNGDVINALKDHVSMFGNYDQIFLHGLTFGAMINSLEKLRDRSYNNEVLKTLKAKNTSNTTICNIIIDIRNQIDIHNEVKEGLNRAIRNTHLQHSYAAA